MPGKCNGFPRIKPTYSYKEKFNNDNSNNSNKNNNNNYYYYYKRTLLNNNLRRRANWIGHILRRNCLLHNVIEGQMTEEKGVRRTQLIDVLRNRRRY